MRFLASGQLVLKNRHLEGLEVRLLSALLADADADHARDGRVPQLRLHACAHGHRQREAFRSTVCQTVLHRAIPVGISEAEVQDRSSRCAVQTHARRL